MKTYVIFQIHPLKAPAYDVTDTSRLIDACGSDSYARIDGRKNLENQIREARIIAARRGRGFVAGVIARGPSLREAMPGRTFTI